MTTAMIEAFTPRDAQIDIGQARQRNSYRRNLHIEPPAVDEATNNPLLVRPIARSYKQLYDALRNFDFRSSPLSQQMTLPAELCERVLSYLTVKRVKQENVEATLCSSHDNVHHLSQTLVGNETTWWLCRPGTMPNGRGNQWVQYIMNRHEMNLQRLSAVSIRIPPMPQGPLSVKEFCLQSFSIERGWHAITPIFTVANQVGWQRFVFEDVDVSEVRLVCLCNQIAEYLDRNELSPYKSRFESVGFFAVQFE